MAFPDESTVSILQNDMTNVIEYRNCEFFPVFDLCQGITEDGASVLVFTEWPHLSLSCSVPGELGPGVAVLPLRRPADVHHVR